MKKTIVPFIFVTIVLLSLTKIAKGQTPTAVSTDEAQVSSPSAIDEEEINTLKVKIATKVAELREKNNKAVGGSVTTVSTGALKIKGSDESNYEIKIDDALTKAYQIVNNQKKEIKIQDIKKGDYIIVTGDLNEKTITANFIYVDELYIVNSGSVSEVNKEDYYIKVLTGDKETFTLDIETFTKQQMLNIKTLKPEVVGFSKVKEGDRLHFVVKRTGTEREVNRFAAQKIFIIPQEYFIK